MIEAGVPFDVLAAAAAAPRDGAAAAPSRSATALLVKNLPYEASVAGLRDLFSGFGAGATRVVLPSTHVFALVEMATPRDAAAALRGLAYRRFLSAPLYLEPAPEGVMGPAAPHAASDAAADAAPAEATVPEPPNDGDGDGDAPTSALFIKNVAFKTSEADLRTRFEAAAAAAGGRLRSLRLATAVKGGGDSKAKSRIVSRGFAFAEFGDAATAAAVRAGMHGVMLDGHALELQAATGAASARDAAPPKRVRRLLLITSTLVLFARA